MHPDVNTAIARQIAAERRAAAAAARVSRRPRSARRVPRAGLAVLVRAVR